MKSGDRADMQKIDYDQSNYSSVLAQFSSYYIPNFLLNSVQPEIAPFDPSTLIILAWNRTWSGSDAPFARHSPLNCTVTLKMGFGVTQGNRKRHYSIEHIGLRLCSSSVVTIILYASIYYRFRDIAAYWSKIASFCYPLVFVAPVGGEAVRFTQRPLVSKN